MKTISHLFIFIALLAITLLTGCATQFSKEEISPAGLNAMRKNSETVLLSVTGGGKNDMTSGGTFGAFNVDNQTLQDAIANSITKSGLFSRVVMVGNADYQLDVLVVLLKAPEGGGLTLTSSARMIWTLTRLQDKKQVFQDEIITEDSKTFGDYMVATTRARAAVAGSVRKNIQEAIEKISKTQF
jgi:hypothetical protein